jgi:hypothetical protein
MLGILFKVITASFPFLKEMLFGRSATGRTRMISFLIICNIATAVSFFTTAKVTASLYVDERKHREEIRDLRAAIISANESLQATKRTNISIVEGLSALTTSVTEIRKFNVDLQLEKARLEVELNHCVPPASRK